MDSSSFFVLKWTLELFEPESSERVKFSALFRRRDRISFSVVIRHSERFRLRVVVGFGFKGH